MSVPMVPFGEILQLAPRELAGSRDFPIMSITMRDGLVDQDKKFKKRIASNDISAYKVVYAGNLVVGFPIDEGVLGFQRQYEAAAVSPAYDIWEATGKHKFDVGYLERVLRSPISRTIYESKMRGTTSRRRTVPKDIFKKIKFPLPPLADQVRIGRILDAADDLRSKRRESLSQHITLTQSVFLEMFGDPVTNPKLWPVYPLGELADNRDSIRIPVKQAERDRRSGQYPYYGSVGIIDDIDDYIFEGPHLLISEDGKHLESRTRPITCLADGRFWVNNHAHVLTFNGKADLIYLANHLELRPIRQYVTGIDQFKLNRKKLDMIPVPLPPLNLQQRFAATVNSIEQQKSRLRAHLEELDILFASLQSRAFKGDL